MIDTFFLVIHKKKVLFLHWYHHITVLLYTWYGYTHASPIGVHMTAMNYTVHAVMYGYYFLMAMKMKLIELGGDLKDLERKAAPVNVPSDAPVSTPAPVRAKVAAKYPGGGGATASTLAGSP